MGDVGDTIFPAPDKSVQRPVPMVGLAAANNEEGEQISWSNPAFAIEGLAVLYITSVSVDERQAPFEIVQTKIFIPAAIEETVVVCIRLLVMVALPVTIDQIPVPAVGKFAEITEEAEQSDWSAPQCESEGSKL